MTILAWSRSSLPFTTREGRSLSGVEITTKPKARDGKPDFLLLGAHQARSWPAAEHAMEWALELVDGYKARGPRIRDLVASTRTIVIPVVNPDAFNVSREAGQTQGAEAGRTGSEAINLATHPLEYKRKNCNVEGSCVTQSGLAEPGVDLSRNYGLFWGGPGAGTNPTAASYRGTGPFSEPESHNIRALISSRHVTTLISNSTFSGLVLRPPGVQSRGATDDEAVYDTLGDAMATETGCLSRKSYQLFDSTGTPEEWSYYSTGALAFGLEIGCNVLDRAGGKCSWATSIPLTQTSSRNTTGPARWPTKQETEADSARLTSLRWRTPRTRRSTRC